MTLPAALVAEGFDPDQVTPGVWGFAVTAILALIIVFLLIDMTRRIRRNTYRAQIREQLEAEAEAEARDAELSESTEGDEPENRV